MSFAIIILAIVAAPVLSVVYLALRWPALEAEQVALVGTVAAVGAAWLAFIAALVAVLAYILADESPALTVSMYGRSLAEGFQLSLSEPDDRGWYNVASPAEMVFTIHNRSSYSARNPALKVRCRDMTIVPNLDWTIQRSGRSDEVTLLWNGGADEAVHGHWDVETPRLIFALNDSDRSRARRTAAITVELVAEGFHLPPQPITLDVRLPPDPVADGLWAGYVGPTEGEIQLDPLQP